MNARPAVLVALMLLGGCGQRAPQPPATVSGASQPVSFKAADGVTVYARLYPAPRPKALVLLFHQAGSSKDEYATIAPRLAAAGYEALAVDARAGGGMYGPNLTAAALGRTATYLEAQADLQAALDWGVRRKLPVVLWGSSYSAALVFPLAAANPGRVKAVLAFSPGEYFDDKTLVARAAAKLAMPVYITSAADTGEITAAGTIRAAVPGDRATQFVPTAGGAHGSSTLIAARDPGGAASNWQAVLAFLRRVAP